MSKYYAIKKGKIPGIYTDWETAKQQILGVSNASYKSFKTKQEAENFINDIIIENNDKNYDIVIYTDGSCINKIGGFGYVILKNNQQIEKYDKIPFESTNQIAELYAIYQSLLYLNVNDYNKSILIKSDSNYSIKCLTEYINKWKNNGFKTINNEEVKNKELIISIDLLLKNFENVKFEHVYSHRGDKYNEIVDKLAKKAIINKF